MRVVGVHEAGDGEGLPSRTCDALGHSRIGVLSCGGRARGLRRDSGSAVGGREDLAGLPGFRGPGGNFRFPGGNQSREQHLEVLDALPQRVQLAADLGLEFRAGDRRARRRFTGSCGRWNSKRADKQPGQCRADKSYLHDASFAHPGRFQERKRDPTPGLVIVGLVSSLWWNPGERRARPHRENWAAWVSPPAANSHPRRFRARSARLPRASRTRRLRRR